MATDCRIEVRTEPLDGIPTLAEERTAVLAPGVHPRRGRGWFLFYREDDGTVAAHHIPHPWAHDLRHAEVMARQHLRARRGRQV